MKTTELELDREVVSAKEWEAARQQLLVREKELTRARDALAAERRRMPWLAVEKEYEFDGPEGKASLLFSIEGAPSATDQVAQVLYEKQVREHAPGIVAPGAITFEVKKGRRRRSYLASHGEL